MTPRTFEPGKSVTALTRRSAKIFSVAVIEESRLAWSQVVGGPADTLFQAGSISKPVTALRSN
jgi:CubicO group peptidase (beta-lactamase class C family)